MKRLACASLLSWLAIGASAFATDPAKTITHYINDAWQTDQGLPQNSVVAIVQTRDGYLWLATQEGLVRFDGIRFTVFDKGNTPEIKENNIQALLEDHKGNLWFGTEGGGLGRVKDGAFSTFTIEDGLGDRIVDAIHEDRNGNLWVGTLGGLSRLSEGHFITYTVKDGLAGNSVLSITEDSQGNLWIGTEEGLSRFRDGTFTTYTTKGGLADNLVRSICEDRAGSLWVGTRAGLSRLKDGFFTSFGVKDGLVSDSVSTVYEDRAGDLWIGTAGGLMRLREGAFSSYTTKNGLSDDEILSIYEDREGNLWLGTRVGGLNRLEPGKFHVYTRQDGLSDDVVRPVYEDRAGNLWIGTAGGLDRLKDGRFNTYTTKQGLASNTVLALEEDLAGELWIGTSGGLNRLRDGKLVTYTTKDGLRDNNVLSIRRGRDGSMWLGTAGGLNRFKDGSLTSYTTSDGLSNDSVWSLLEDRSGDLWVGTDGGGLNRLKDGRFTVFTTRDGLANDIVLSMYEDGEGALWLGTSGGLSRLKDGAFSNISAKDGLFDDTVFQILEDSAGSLWMSCNKGIFRVNKQELKEFCEGRIKSVTSISYGTADGLKSRECNGGFQPAGFKTRDERLWFPTIKGLAVIDPDSIKLNELPPPVIIEHVIADGEPIAKTENARIAPGRGKFEFHFTGLSFMAPQRVRFKYKLEGFEDYWVDAGTRRDASFTNLAPGDYRFTVVACNNDGIWNEKGASFAFYVTPHFYQTYWAYAIYGAVLVLISLGIYRLRLRQMESQFAAVLAERTRIAREIHDTLAQGFAGISLQLESVAETMSEAPDLARQHLNRARVLVRSSLADARRSVWQLRSQALDDTDIASVLSTAARQLTAGQPVEVRVQAKGATRRLPADIETNLLHIGREALTNAVKHARASTIDIELRFEEETVLLQVKDDGCGFDVQRPPSRGDGFGLIGMRERAQQIKAKMTVSSEQGKGTEVSVEVSAI